MMKPFLQPRELLKALASGKSVSGAGLADRVGVTRAAIWKHIDALRARGLPIDARTGLGYRLPWPTQLLEVADIKAQLEIPDQGPLEVHWELDSTSSELARRQASLSDLSVMLAEGQQAGRGRRGRTWLSPPGLNIYLSRLKRFEHGFAGLSGLSLTVGVAVAQALEDVGAVGLGLKWPNDVQVGGCKLAGILVELSGEYQGPCVAIVGVGINVRLPPAMREEIEQPVTDLAEVCHGDPPDRNLVAARLVTRLRAALCRFETDGFAAFVDDYARLDLLRDKALRLDSAQGTFEGIGAGVDAQGALLVHTRQGEVRVDSAEVTVRAK